MCPYIPPSVSDRGIDNTPALQLSKADIAAQARQAALTLGQTAQSASKNAAETFNRFVEGDNTLAPRNGAAKKAGPDEDHKDFWDTFGAPPSGPSADKKSFWDEFAATGEQVASKPKPTSVGTAAMKKGGSGGASGAPAKKDDDGWGDW